MGRGSYLGGHTVIGPRSGWFSHAKPKGSVKVASQTNGLGLIARKPETRGAKSNLTVGDFGQLRLVFLHAVIQAAIADMPPPNAPKKARAHLDAEARKAGGVLEWARAQPEFPKLYEKKRKRHLARALLADAAQTQKTSDGPTEFIEILQVERLKVLAAREEALRLLRHFEERLDEIDRQLHSNASRREG